MTRHSRTAQVIVVIDYRPSEETVIITDVRIYDNDNFEAQILRPTGNESAKSSGADELQAFFAGDEDRGEDDDSVRPYPPDQPVEPA